MALQRQDRHRINIKEENVRRRGEVVRPNQVPLNHNVRSCIFDRLRKGILAIRDIGNAS
jgi:hypothetical protein